MIRTLTLKSGRTIRVGPTPAPETGDVRPTRFSTPELDRTLTRLASARTPATAPELVGPDDPDWPTLATDRQTLARLADCPRTFQTGTGPLAPSDWHRPREKSAPAPTDTAGRPSPASAPKRERDNSLTAMLRRAGRPERTTGRRDDPTADAGRWPLPDDVSARIVSDWIGATPADLLAVLAVLADDPDATVTTSDGCPVLAREMVDPLRHLLARAVRRRVGFTDPAPRVPRSYARMARRNGNARRSSVAVVG